MLNSIIRQTEIPDKNNQKGLRKVDGRPCLAMECALSDEVTFMM